MEWRLFVRPLMECSLNLLCSLLEQYIIFSCAAHAVDEDSITCVMPNSATLVAVSLFISPWHFPFPGFVLSFASVQPSWPPEKSPSWFTVLCAGWNDLPFCFDIVVSILRVPCHQKAVRVDRNWATKSSPRKVERPRSKQRNSGTRERSGKPGH